MLGMVVGTNGRSAMRLRRRAKPEQLSKRKQRSSMRLADFRRRMEQRDQAAAAKLRRLWSVVWLQRLVRRRLTDSASSDTVRGRVQEVPGGGNRVQRRQRALNRPPAA